jgi:hypothetical protein
MMHAGLRRRYGAAARPKPPTSEQLGVLEKLVTDPDRRLIRIPGGFWTTPVIATEWDSQLVGRAPWHASTQTAPWSGAGGSREQAISLRNGATIAP